MHDIEIRSDVDMRAVNAAIDDRNSRAPAPGTEVPGRGCRNRVRYPLDKAERLCRAEDRGRRAWRQAAVLEQVAGGDGRVVDACRGDDRAGDRGRSDGKSQHWSAPEAVWETGGREAKTAPFSARCLDDGVLQLAEWIRFPPRALQSACRASPGS